MKALAGLDEIVPKPRQRHYSYDESLDEGAGLIANEPAEIEEETPAEESVSVERFEVNIPRKLRYSKSKKSEAIHRPR